MKFLKLDEVKAITGLSRSAIYLAISEGKFPSQVKLGVRSVVWVDSEIQEWMSSRLESRRHV